MERIERPGGGLQEIRKTKIRTLNIYARTDTHGKRMV